MLVVLLHDHQVVLDDVVLPNGDDLAEEGLSVLTVARQLEQLPHVEVALAQVDALRPVLLALLVDARSQLVQRLFVSVRSVLRHEEAAEGNVKCGVEAIEFLFRHKSVFAACASVLRPVLSTLQQIPVRRDQELLRLFKLGAAHTDVCLGQDEVGWQELDRLLIENLLLDGRAHSVIDVLVGFLELVVDDVPLGLLDCPVDLFALQSQKEQALEVTD